MKRLVVLMYILCWKVSIAQTLSQQAIFFANEPLNRVLTAIERKYDVRFSYQADLVRGVYISVPSSTYALMDLLDLLRQKTGYRFQKVNVRYFVIKSNDGNYICGYLKDGLKGIPLEGASVYMELGHNGTTTDSEGYFNIDGIHRTDTLIVSFLGYKTLRVAIDQGIDTGCNTYAMQAEGFTLNEVVVKDYLASGISKTKGGLIKIKPNDQSILFGLVEPDPLQNVQLLPGVENLSESVSDVHIRGGSPDQNLILWDGIKMYKTDHFFGMLSIFNPYVVKDVKVIRNGTNPRYGDRVSGVIDIRTENRLPKKLKGGVGLSMTHADVLVKAPVLKRAGIVASVRRSITDLFSTPTIDAYSQKTFQNIRLRPNNDVQQVISNEEDYFYQDITVKTIADISRKDKVGMSSLFTKNDLNYKYSISEIEGNFSYKNFTKTEGFSATWDRNWNSVLGTQLLFYFSGYDLVFDQDNPQFEGANVHKDNHVQEMGISLHTVRHLDERWAFTGGWQFSSNSVAFDLKNELYDTALDEESHTNSAYIHLSHNNPDKWYVNLGCRLNHYSNIGGVSLAPRMYIERAISGDFSLTGSVERKYQSVSQILEIENNGTGNNTKVWALANGKDIPVLKSDQISFGGQFDWETLDIDVDVYLKKGVQYTSLVRGVNLEKPEYEYGEGLIKGLDVLVKKKIGRYTTYLGYTYSNADYKFENLNEGRPFSADNDITHSMKWSHYYKIKNWELSLGWKYRSGTPYTPLDGETGTSGNIGASINTERLPEYHRLDFSAQYSYNFLKESRVLKGKLGFSLLNLYGRKNILDRNYLGTSLGIGGNNRSEALGLDYLSLGLTPNIIFRLDFE